MGKGEDRKTSERTQLVYQPGCYPMLAFHDDGDRPEVTRELTCALWTIIDGNGSMAYKPYADQVRRIGREAQSWDRGQGLGLLILLPPDVALTLPAFKTGRGGLLGTWTWRRTTAAGAGLWPAARAL